MAVARRAIGCGVAVAVAAGCALSDASPDLPAPGTERLLSVEDVADIPDCATRRSPLLRVDASEVEPTQARAGAAINHRLVYTLCTRAPAPLTGTMTTLIIANGTRLLTNTLHDYEIRPGRWVINTRIGVPTEVEPRTYFLQTDFRAAAAKMTNLTRFDVVP